MRTTETQKQTDVDWEDFELLMWKIGEQKVGNVGEIESEKCSPTYIDITLTSSTLKKNFVVETKSKFWHSREENSHLHWSNNFAPQNCAISVSLENIWEFLSNKNQSFQLSGDTPTSSLIR